MNSYEGSEAQELDELDDDPYDPSYWDFLPPKEAEKMRELVLETGYTNRQVEMEMEEMDAMGDDDYFYFEDDYPNPYDGPNSHLLPHFCTTCCMGGGDSEDEDMDDEDGSDSDGLSDIDNLPPLTEQEMKRLEEDRVRNKYLPFNSAMTKRIEEREQGIDIVARALHLPDDEKEKLRSDTRTKLEWYDKTRRDVLRELRREEEEDEY